MLDLFCGTGPYAETIPWEPAWGLDLDHHFGRADIVGNVPSPVRDASVGVVVVTQARHMVDDPRRTLDEMRRALRPGGFAVVTIPHLFLGEGEFERRWWIVRAVYRPAVLVLNAVAIDLVLPRVLRRRWPQSFILTARRPPRSERAGG